MRPMMRSESLWSRRAARSMLRSFTCSEMAVARPCASTTPSVSATSGARCTRRSGSPPVILSSTVFAIISGEDGRRTEAMVMIIDGMVWPGFTSGLIVRWDANGNRLQEFHHHPFDVQCFCTFGPRIWVGYVSGTVQVLDLDGKLLRGWIAHSAPVINMATGASYIFTLASHGGIRGWNITSPGPLDNVIHSESSGKEFLYTRLEKLKILVRTWNVAEGRASSDSLISWLGSAALDADMVIVVFQELEMGAGVLAMSAARESLDVSVAALVQELLSFCSAEFLLVFKRSAE